MVEGSWVEKLQWVCLSSTCTWEAKWWMCVQNSRVLGVSYNMKPFSTKLPNWEKKQSAEKMPQTVFETPVKGFFSQFGNFWEPVLVWCDNRLFVGEAACHHENDKMIFSGELSILGLDFGRGWRVPKAWSTCIAIWKFCQPSDVGSLIRQQFERDSKEVVAGRKYVAQGQTNCTATQFIDKQTLDNAQNVSAATLDGGVMGWSHQPAQINSNSDVQCVCVAFEKMTRFLFDSANTRSLHVHVLLVG